MLERLNEPVAFFLLIMSIILVTPLLSERVRLPDIIGIILGNAGRTPWPSTDRRRRSVGILI
jgi:hypothetical protein